MLNMMSNGRVPKKSTKQRSNESHEPLTAERARKLILEHRVESQSITGQDILNTENVELRRVLIERLGYETFLQQVGGVVRDQDKDVGGQRQLVCIAFDDDEPLMVLKVTCPSTGHTHILRVPPHLRSCHQAAAWVAGFNDSEDYSPLVEA